MNTESHRPAAFIIIALFLLVAGRLWHLQIIQGKKHRMLSESNRLRMVNILAPRGIIFDRNGIPLVRNAPYYSVSLRPEMRDVADTSEIAPFLGISEQEIERRISASKSLFEPVRLKEGIAFEDVLRLEARISEQPALMIDVDIMRQYLYGEVGAHLIGYIGRLTPAQTGMPEFSGVPREAFTGQWGIERLYDKALRGTPGKRLIEVDALGRELRIIRESQPIKGSDLALSLDIRLQKAAEEAFGERAGALVAMEPRTGEILGLVSRPTFNPNHFSKGISHPAWQALLEDKRHPMLNRAFQSRYPPGSVFKIVTAAAALEENAIDPSTSFTCSGEYVYGNWSFRCWKKGGHGTLSLHRAIVESCDVYFYLAGKRTGIEALARHARAFGLEKQSGLGLVEEEKGIIPDPEWKLRKINQKWYLGETLHASIGQGYVALTPFELASLTAVVSNGGYILRPSLTKAESSGPAQKVKVSEKTLEILKDAMRGVVNEPGGTGWASKSTVATISGKTGTAQVVSLRKGGIGGRFEDHAWFVAYAPEQDPRIALSVIVEHGGHGGAAAAPIAKKAIEAYLSEKEDGSEDR